MTPQNAEAIRPDSADSAITERDEESAAAARINAAKAQLGPSAPELERFCQSLYCGAPPEDITRFSSSTLAALAGEVFVRSDRRVPGTTMVDIFEVRPGEAEGELSETIFLAVNDDMPFLFDSLMGELAARNIRAHALFHPILRVQRDAAGRRSPHGEAVRESLIVAVLDPAVDRQTKQFLIEGAGRVFAQVGLAVRDWRRMLAQLEETVTEMRRNPPSVKRELLDESIAFLEWLGDNHFTFLGSRDYAYREGNGGHLDPIAESGLGLLSDAAARVIERGPEHAKLSPEVQAFFRQPEPLIITKANERSVVHRRVYMDYIGVKRFDANGRLSGERRFIGLFTSAAYSRRPGDIPLLRLKIAHITARADLPPDSHDGKALAHILDTYPREELFQASEDEIFATALGILRLGERPRIRVFLRFDRFDRFVSALVFVPRDRYDALARERIHALLARAFDGRMSAAIPVIDESQLARIHYIIGRNKGPRPSVDVRQLESEIRATIRTWGDGFAQSLIKAYGELEGLKLLRRHAGAFPPRYRDAFPPDEAVRDLGQIGELLDRTGFVGARPYRLGRDNPSTLRLKLYVLGRMLPLSACLPVFENLGFRVIAEDSYAVSLDRAEAPGAEAAILDFQMERADGEAIAEDRNPALREAVHAILSGSAEDDGLNRLVVAARLAWRDVTVLRACAKYLRQAGFAFSQNYIEQALSRSPSIAALLVSLFRALHDPQQEDRSLAADALGKSLDAALEGVASLDDDRIIRRLRNVIECILRTNYFQRNAHGHSPDHFCMKLASHKIAELPAPRPLYEVFVYSPQVEAVHLRFGKVARGGIRWSDRREDFRTEILGLVKAQQVKNAVIVPVGAKGGFFPKQISSQSTREDIQTQGVAAYRIFIHALLDITDNIGPDGTVVPPASTVRYDGDDPYLVVAADKGTASFSDIANEIAISRGFWLGDAFASGGSHGYDHKKMGITAKGAWEAVKRHFREMGRDVQAEPFTCVGVGDMSGDVFGNGMLLSKQTRLLAAFDHRHVFLDPDPDPATSWTERRRLFDLPRSSWADYDTRTISRGGSVYLRSSKEIVLSPEAKALAGIGVDKVSPNELIRALLKMQVDLLWFGGIGTFIKASGQTNLEVGDRANDAVRVNGYDVRSLVIGEGANLGVTQLGRVEYALKGGRINTDAIDNSAGVDTSDHEVNIKVLFSGPLRRGILSPDERDHLLNEMAGDVATHVLRDNYDQTLAISVAEARGLRDLDSQGRFMRDLERRGKLDRAVEFLPDDAELHRRAVSGRGLTRPELAVLLAYAKLDLDSQIVASDLPDQTFFAAELAAYFPASAVARFPDALIHHRLRREIIATVLSNRIVNLAGLVFAHRLEEISNAPASRVARAFVLAEGALGLTSLKAHIDALDGSVPAHVQIGAYDEIQELLRRLGLWFLINIPTRADLGDTIARYRAGVESLRGSFATLVSSYEAQATEARIAQLRKAGVPLDLADEIAVVPLLAGVPEIVMLAHARGLPIDAVAGAYFATGAAVGLDRLRGLAAHIAGHEHWDRLAVRRVVDDLYASQRVLTADALLGSSWTRGATRADGREAAKHWEESHADALARTRTFLAELENSGDLSIAKLTLANSQIRTLAEE